MTEDIQAILGELEDHKLAYVMARSRSLTDSAAYAETCGKKMFYTWPAEERAKLNAMAQQLKRHAAMRAQLVLEDAVEDAARRLVRLIDSKNPNVSLKASTEVLDRVAGKPVQRQEVSGPDGGALKVVLSWPRSAGDADGDSDIAD